MLYLPQQIRIKIHHLKYQLHSSLSTLNAVSPLATLDRGYAIASKDNKVLYSTAEVEIGDTIALRLAVGNLSCAVTAIKDESDA